MGSDDEIVVHLGNILDAADHPADITFQWLADRLRTSPVEIWVALDQPNNDAFVSALYAAKASEWGYEINLDKPGTPFVFEPGEDDAEPLKTSMPREPPPRAEALRWLDDGQNSQSDWFLFWSLPRAELWLPKNIATMTGAPAIDAEQGARSRKCSMGWHVLEASATGWRDEIREDGTEDPMRRGGHTSGWH